MTKNIRRKRIYTIEMWYYRWLLRESWKDRKISTWALEKIGSDLMLQNNIENRKLQCFGHISRKQGSMEKGILQGMI